MKGRNKDFNRYLDYELNDCYLEAPEKSKQKLFQEDKATKYKQFCHNDTALSKNIPDDPSTFRYHSESPMFHDFSINMDNNGADLERILDFMTSPQRKEPYRCFDRPPLICLTTNSKKEVSLWQSPYLTSTFNNFNLDRTLIIGSFNLLTQFPFARKEKTVDTRFIDDRWFYIVSTEDESLFNIRFYDVKILIDAINTGKVNSTPSIGLYSFKLIISNYKTQSDSQNFIHIALWKNEILNNHNPDLRGPKDGAENTVKVVEKTYKGTHIPFSQNMSDLPYILRGSNGVTILMDSANSYYIALSEKSIITANYHAGELKSIRQVDNTIFMRNKSGVDYEISLEKFPQVQMKQISLSAEMVTALDIIDENNAKHQNINNIIKKNKVDQLGSNLTFQYYLYRKPLTEGSMEDNEFNKNENEEEDVEKEESIFVRIQKVKKEHKRTKSGDDMFQIRDDMLKEIRSDIRTKIKEARKFDAEYKQGEKIKRSDDFTEPEGVAKEKLELYKEIKTEKKNMRKDIEKKKDHRKNGKIAE